MPNLNEMPDKEIRRRCRENPDRLAAITLAMAEACQRTASDLYVTSARLIEAIEGNGACSESFGEFVNSLHAMYLTAEDTRRIFNAANEGAGEAGH